MSWLRGDGGDLAMRGDAAWRRNRREEQDTALDDLLAGQEFTTTSAPVRGGRGRWLGRSAMMAFAASAVLYTLLRVFSLALPYALLLAACVAAVLIRRAVSMTREPYASRTREVIRPRGPTGRIDPGGWLDDRDGVSIAVGRWERRIEWGITEPRRFFQTAVPAIGELADERLRQYHGITRVSDPVRARALLGEQLWALLHEEPRRVPTSRQVTDLVSTLERLQTGWVSGER